MPDPLTLPAFAFQPNWDEPPVLRLRALTDLWAGATGREERNARLQTPALATRFQVDTGVEHEQSQQIARFFRQHVGSAIVSPLWSELVFVAGPITGVTIPVTSTSSRFFAPARAALIWQSPSQYQVFTLDSLTESTVVSHETIAGSYTTEAVVVPVIVTEPITDEQSLEWLTTFFASGQVEFLEAVDSAVAFPSPCALASYRGLPIWPFLFNEEARAHHRVRPRYRSAAGRRRAG